MNTISTVNASQSESILVTRTPTDSTRVRQGPESLTRAPFVIPAIAHVMVRGARARVPHRRQDPPPRTAFPLARTPRLTCTVHAIFSAMISGSSCSHARTSVHPPSVSAWLSAWSRASLRSNFACQNSVLVRGRVAWTGQRCQKQPSMKTATLAGPKTMSGRTQRAAVSTRLSFLKRRPRACSADRSRRSGRVSVLRLACMVLGPPTAVASSVGHRRSSISRSLSIVAPCCSTASQREHGTPLGRAFGMIVGPAARGKRLADCRFLYLPPL